MRTLPPTDPEWPQPEPPAYLRGALRAAAAARARTARIRAGAWAPGGAGEDPRAAAGAALEVTEKVRPDLEREVRDAPDPRADPSRATGSASPRHPRARQLSFARTVAAVAEVRSAVTSEGAEDPWHLCLRGETDTRDGAGRWLSRLLRPLRRQRQPTAPHPELLSLGYQAAAATRQPGAPAPIEPAGDTQGANSARSGIAAGPGQAPPQGTGPPARPTSVAWPEREPASLELLRLPPLGQRTFHPEELPSDLPDQPRGARGPARWGASQAPHPAPSGVLAGYGTQGAVGPAALAARWRSQLTGADAIDRRGATAAPRSQAVVPVIPAASGMHQLPAIVQRGALPSLRLLDYQAREVTARGGSARRQANARPASSADPRAARRRSVARLITLGFAIVGGFGLGIVANGGALLTGSKLSQALLALETHVFDRPAEAPPASSAPQRVAALGDRVPPSDPAPGRAASDGSVAKHAERPRAQTTAGAASSAQNAARAAAAAPPVSSAAAGENARARAPSARAIAPAPATPTAVPTGWEALYAEGHRFQLQGNLVAAADAYRRAIGLNPHHPAMLYDLGYVLQMQGQTDAAMDYYRQTIALEPDHAYAHYNLGDLLQEQGESAAAARHYEIAAARLPENAYIYYDWAWSLETVGDLAGAAALYRKAIEIDPDRRPGSDARRRLAALGAPGHTE